MFEIRQEDLKKPWTLPENTSFGAIATRAYLAKLSSLERFEAIEALRTDIFASGSDSAAVGWLEILERAAVVFQLGDISPEDSTFNRHFEKAKKKARKTIASLCARIYFEIPYSVKESTGRLSETKCCPGFLKLRERCIEYIGAYWRFDDLEALSVSAFEFLSVAANGRIGRSTHPDLPWNSIGNFERRHTEIEELPLKYLKSRALTGFNRDWLYSGPPSNLFFWLDRPLLASGFHDVLFQARQKMHCPTMTSIADEERQRLLLGVYRAEHDNHRPRYKQGRSQAAIDAVKCLAERIAVIEPTLEWLFDEMRGDVFAQSWFRLVYPSDQVPGCFHHAFDGSNVEHVIVTVIADGYQWEPATASALRKDAVKGAIKRRVKKHVQAWFARLAHHSETVPVNKVTVVFDYWNPEDTLVFKRAH